MIPQYVIQQWKSTAPWQTNTQVEHDLILTKALITLYQNQTIRENLAFRGGTALNKCHFKPAARYSEDLDFVLISDVPVGDTISAIRSVLDPWLGKARWTQTEKFKKLTYRFMSEDSPPRPLRLKIEINALLAIGDSYLVANAFDAIHQSLIAHLPGKPWQGTNELLTDTGILLV